MELINFIWPLVTLVYPLHASVRAIESNSLDHNRKCLTYWIAYGLITLFEFTSAGLIEWLPFWSYIKLVGTSLLVARHFEGAVYIYDHLVRPCFSINPCATGYWLRIKGDEFSVSNSDNFVLIAKKFVQENGPEALEKVIDKVNSVERKLAIDKEKSVWSMNNREGNPLKEIKSEGSLNGSGLEATAISENSTITEANVARASECPPLSFPNKAQKEWTCALCQVCTPNEVSLHKHLQGKNHKANEEKLKVSTSAQTNYKAAAAESKTQPIGKVGVTGRQCELPGILNLDNTERDWSCPLSQVYSRDVASLLDHLQGKEHKAGSVSNSGNTKKPKVTPKEGMPMPAQTNYKAGRCESPESSIQDTNIKNLTCTLCQISTPNEIALQDHFQGRKHKAKQVELSAKVSAANNKMASASVYSVKPNVIQKGSVSASMRIPKSVKISEGMKVGETGAGGKQSPLSELWCDKCQLQCNSVSMLTDHLGGRRHLWCDKCQLQCNSVSMLTDHLGGRRHKSSNIAEK